MKYVLYGAGDYGRRMLTFIGKENVCFFIDNDEKKWNTSVEGINIISINNAKNLLKNKTVVISVSSEKEPVIIDSLEQNGIMNYICYKEIMEKFMKKKILSRTNFIEQYNKAIQWIFKNTIDGKGIICHNYLNKSYPEVTGYFIPTLLRWGYRELAISYAKWLCSIQKTNGSWYDSEDKAPYIFDTAQILKGLLAVRNLTDVDSNILAGCEWIFSCMQNDGRLITPVKDAWGKNRDICDEVIHIYCISPLIEAANVYGKDEYKEKALQIWKYYKIHYYDKIIHFSLLSHFYAYLMEALLDIGESEMAKKAMMEVEGYQKESGAVPALNNCDWVCSTGIFQLALVWFRLGNIERGNKAFSYAIKLQNESGGWFGSYPSEENNEESPTYFPTSEISWVIKFFLDALYYKNAAEFEKYCDKFPDSINKADGRYQLVMNELKIIKKTQGKLVLDVGCGKGRYLKNLFEDFPENNYYGVDISTKVMNFFDDNIAIKRQGTMTCIPFEEDFFDLTYACESLEHAVDIKNAILEMVRVTKPGGKIVIIDKSIKALGRLDIDSWEQWFDIDEIKEMLEQYCSSVKIYSDISYENGKNDGLFYAWIGKIAE